ncbi:hypothetical protein [Chenggangzhangella methanolivorans]|uniref:Uncharacterized protein n=1 Tax=Chenggangzhangella methanolivorans TaxID=1437009 RepID=A0A9E6RBF3_9HYPH|nr:hypothetical protein [Chenggangzhangella methanolivorans]QZO01137.1 hypothetical protein K6K41_06170 [Chenggangzhangella methanolivorans]
MTSQPTSPIRASPSGDPSDNDDIRSLLRQVTTALSALPVEVDGDDDMVRNLAAYHGLRPSDAVITKLRTNTRSFTLLVATSNSWELNKRALLATKQDGERVRRKVLLMPAGRLRRTVFLTNCSLIGSSRNVQITATHRMAILAHLQTDPLASLEDCSREIAGHDDPVGAVLAMIAEGFLRMDLRVPMRPESVISVA